MFKKPADSQSNSPLVHRLLLMKRYMRRQALEALRVLVYRHRSLPRSVKVETEFFSSVQAQLDNYGIRTEIQGGSLVAYLRFEHREADDYLVDFAEFMVSAPYTVQAQWLELCLCLPQNQLSP